MTAISLVSSQCMLGESPTWHHRKQCCFWVDITGHVLYSFHWITKETRQWKFNEDISLIVESTGDHLLIALKTTIVKFDTETGKIESLFDIEPTIKNHRCNDGGCDVKGRLWVGSTHEDHNFERGVLYAVELGSSPIPKIKNVTISNGLVWSLDNSRMYFIDSPTQEIRSYVFNQESGEIVFEKIAIRIPIEMGTPDGMTIDREGMLWIAHWGGYGVYRWNPNTGDLITKIDVPAPHVTSCAFAGEDLGTLIITTAQKNMTPDQLKDYPQSGNLFTVSPGIAGVKANRCIF